VGRTPARYVALLIAALAVADASGEPPAFVALPALPEPLASLSGGASPEAFAIAPGVAIVAVPSGEAGRSTLRARVRDRVVEFPAPGRVTALAVAPSGAWAIVRESDRKGVDRRASLVILDLEAGHVGRGAPVPVSAQGLALLPAGDAILVASTNEIRTFLLPSLTSGPLFRVPGQNVGIGPTTSPTVWVVAQPERVGLLDVSQPQGREGLALAETAPAPVPLRALFADGEGGILAVGQTGDAWRVEVRLAKRAAGEPPPIPDPVPLPVPHEVPPAAPPPVPPPAVAVESEAAPPPSEAPVPTPLPPPVPAPSPEPTPTPTPTPAPVQAPPGSLTGVLSGPAVTGVAAIVALGPDNVLKEAARVAPAADGSFRFDGLAPGSYRLVASGASGRVVLCDPPYLSVRLDGSQAVAAPAWRAIRVP